MTDSQTLLGLYARDGSESAFRELVSRYIDLVYSTAFRLVDGDAQSAQDVAQTVFLALARKARTLPSDVMLGGWLHQHTRFVAAKLVRTERRRQIREQQAVEMNAIEDHSEQNLAQVAPVLDEVIGELDEQDRTAILLRFFERKDFHSVGDVLGSSEDAARKRVMRAVEKLHVLLKGRGVTMSVATLGTVLATQTIQAAPAGLAASVAGSALAGAASGAGFMATLIKLAAMTKVQAGVLGAVVLAGATASVLIQHQTRTALQAQDASMRQQAPQLTEQEAEHERLAGLAQAGGSPVNTLDELVRLRSEVESLRQQTNSVAASMNADQRARARNSQSPSASRSLLEMREEQRDRAIAVLNYTKRWLLAFHMFANDNGEEFPTSFEQAQPYWPKEPLVDTNFTTGQFEIVYRGSLTNITSPAQLVVLRQKQPAQTYDGRWYRGYGFADGHSEVASSPDGNYEAWEKRHVFLPPPER
jgi:RNA polymerase sigma factor (sigma-70 family)